MTKVALDKESMNSLAERLDRVAAEFTDAERNQLITLLTVGSSEAARIGGLKPEQAKEAEVEPFDMAGRGFHRALEPLTSGRGETTEVELFYGCEVTLSGGYQGPSGQASATLVIGSGGTASASSGSASGSSSGSTKPAGSGKPK